MDMHFVEKYTGEYYFSGEDSSVIQSVGEDSGNGDNIVFTFDDENTNEPFDSLSEYLTNKLIFERDKLVKRLYYYHVEQIGVNAAITEVSKEVIISIDTSKMIVKSLLDDNQIDKEFYKRMIDLLEERLNDQLEYIKYFDKVGLAMSIYNKNKVKEKKKEK